MTEQTAPQVPLPFQLSRMIASLWVPRAIYAAAALGVADVLADAMVELTRHLATPIALSYDFSEVQSLVDVGGGSGALLAGILKAYPAMRGTVADFPHCREGALRLFEKTKVADRAGASRSCATAAPRCIPARAFCWSRSSCPSASRARRSTR